MLYRKKCCTPTCWLDPGEKQFTSTEMMHITDDKVKIARDPLHVVRERKKKYSMKKHRLNTFTVGEKVMLKVSPWKGIIRFSKQDTLGPRSIGPLVVSELIGSQTYILELPLDIEGSHDVFHVLYLHKCLAEEPSILPMDELRVDESKSLVEEIETILEHETKQLCKNMVELVKILWKKKHEVDITWELGDDMRARYPHLFIQVSNSETKSY
ncbi:hypothetical protein Lser_V15G24102 [Lactuca serriola]